MHRRMRSIMKKLLKRQRENLKIKLLDLHLYTLLYFTIVYYTISYYTILYLIHYIFTILFVLNTKQILSSSIQHQQSYYIHTLMYPIPRVCCCRSLSRYSTYTYMYIVYRESSTMCFARQSNASDDLLSSYCMHFSTIQHVYLI